MTTKNCANGPKLVLKDLREKYLSEMSSYPFFKFDNVMIVLHSVEG